MTHTFVQCLNEQCELFVAGYYRSVNASHNIPIDVVRKCFLFLPSSIIIPNLKTPSFLIPQSSSSHSDFDEDESLSDDDHLCEDEINDRDYIWENQLLGICKYIKTMPTANTFTKQYKAELVKDYNNSLPFGTNVIIQQIKPMRNKQSAMKQTLNEVQMQNALNPHPHIQRLHDIQSTNDQKLTLLMYDYADTTLHHLCRSGHCLSEIQIKYILYQILLAIKCIHAANICHNNIKPQNILVSNDCSVKISNFKQAKNINCVQSKTKIIKTQNRYLYTMNLFLCCCCLCLTLFFYLSYRRKLVSKQRKKMGLKRTYRKRNLFEFEYCNAPEIMISKETQFESKVVHKEKKASDIWSVGMIFSELIKMQKSSNKNKQQRRSRRGSLDMNAISNEFLAILSSETSADDVENILQNRKIQKYLNGLPRYLYDAKELKSRDVAKTDLLLKLLCFDPSKRISVEDALSHPYLQNIRSIVYEKKYCRN